VNSPQTVEEAERGLEIVPLDRVVHSSTPTLRVNDSAGADPKRSPHGWRDLARQHDSITRCNRSLPGGEAPGSDRMQLLTLSLSDSGGPSGRFRPLRYIKRVAGCPSTGLARFQGSRIIVDDDRHNLFAGEWCVRWLNWIHRHEFKSGAISGYAVNIRHQVEPDLGPAADFCLRNRYTKGHYLMVIVRPCHAGVQAEGVANTGMEVSAEHLTSGRWVNAVNVEHEVSAVSALLNLKSHRCIIEWPFGREISNVAVPVVPV
jgi:hypothetical protein